MARVEMLNVLIVRRQIALTMYVRGGFSKAIDIKKGAVYAAVWLAKERKLH